MKSFELKALGLEELDYQSMKITSGGNPMLVELVKDAFAVIGALSTLLFGADIIEAIYEGYQEEKASEYQVPGGGVGGGGR